MMKIKYIRKRETVETCKLNIYVVPFLYCDKSALVIQVTYPLRLWKWSTLERENSRNTKINI